MGGWVVGRGLGALVNTCKQCQKGGALAVGCVGRDFEQEIIYFGGSRVHYTHLGCFGARGEAGGGWRVLKWCQILKICPN